MFLFMGCFVYWLAHKRSGDEPKSFGQVSDCWSVSKNYDFLVDLEVCEIGVVAS
jgi:hypothetical protein